MFILEVAKNWFKKVPMCTANIHLSGLNYSRVKFKKAIIGENIIYQVVENPDLSLEEIMKEVYKSISKQASKKQKQKIENQWNNKRIKISSMNEENDTKKSKNYFICNGFRYILLTNNKPNK